MSKIRKILGQASVVFLLAIFALHIGEFGFRIFRPFGFNPLSTIGYLGGICVAEAINQMTRDRKSKFPASLLSSIFLIATAQRWLDIIPTQFAITTWLQYILASIYFFDFSVNWTGKFTKKNTNETTIRSI